MPTRLRVAALVVGLVAALAPAALLAYNADSGKAEGPRIVAQATPTATPRPATPTVAAPRTGNAGLASGQTGVAVIAVLAAIAVAGIAGGRVLTRRS